MSKYPTQRLTDLYDKYSAMLYGIALQISSTDGEAAQILLTTFEEAQEQNIVEKKGHCIWATLIQLTMTTARQQMGGRFKHDNLPKLFAANPLLRKVLLENKSIRQIRNETGLTLADFGKMLREEVNTIRDAQKETAAGHPHAAH